MASPRKRIAIITPALRQANNGNWRTASRWARFLRDRYAVTVAADWAELRDKQRNIDCLIALHARKSAASIAAFARTCPDKPRVLLLTGTDLYQDIHGDALARRSLDLATHLVVLQEEGLGELRRAHREKCRVIYQSAEKLKRAQPNRRTFDVVFVAHMRDVKDPLTPMRALDQLPAASRIRLIHVGSALEHKYLLAARQLQERCRRYAWLRALPHAQTRQRIARARLLILSSLMEGGANAIIEAVTAGVPVLASRVSGNIGMLGRDYQGYFPAGDDKALAQLLDRAEREPHFIATLKRQCRKRMPRFSPRREKLAVTQLVKQAMLSSAEASGTDR
jgi:putative glycosyltransferase (TIGR04348 family)